MRQQFFKRLIKRLIWQLIGFSIGLIGTFIIKANRTEILIKSSAGTFRFWHTTFICFTIIEAIISIVILTIEIIKVTKAHKNKQKKDVKLLEADLPKAKLSLESGELDEGDVRSLLLEIYSSVEPDIREVLENYIQQMDIMNGYQAKLNRMLTINGIKDLQETEVLLNRLEQAIFANLRKAFNWINMREPTKAAREKLHDNLEKVRTDNQEILGKASELCRVLTDYINNQENTGYSTVVFDNFIKSLTEQLEEVN